MVRVAFVMGDYPSKERARREQVALSYSSAEVEVGIISVPMTPYVHGLTEAEIARVVPAVLQGYAEAQKQGYHAAVPLGGLDLGIDAGRSAVDIPVIGPFQAALYVASLLGDRFGLITYHPHHNPILQAMVRRYGMEQKVVAFGSAGFDLPDMAANENAVRDNLVATARRLIRDHGAEVIYPTGISLCPVHISPLWLTEQIGAPVVEGIGAPIRLAAMLAHLGLTHSRLRWPKSAMMAGDR